MLSIRTVARSHPARKHPRAFRGVPLLILVALVSCEVLGPTAPLPDHAVAFIAPSQYQEWWARTEDCSGRRGTLEGIAWFVVPDASTFMTPEGAKVGRWSRGGDGTQIVIAGAYLLDELVVRHEMLHALLVRGDHPREYFADRCHLTWQRWGG
jgi:hypothetical protein